MLNRKALAKTSNTPGKTRQINFYNIDNKFYFVDLPGYGYSEMSKTEKIKSGKFIEEYLCKCENICVIILLLDIRHTPTADDKLMYRFLIDNNLPFFVITNKADKIAITKVNSSANEIREILNPMHDINFFPFSSERKIYTDDIWNEIERYLPT